MYIIAGCNGAGKTTTAFTILPEMLDCKEYVNADNIAAGLSPFQPENVNFEAGRVMLLRINQLAKSKVDFAIETTLSSKNYLMKIHEWKRIGYEINLLFFWLKDHNLAMKRIKERVAKGGHNIEDEIVIRRYKRGIVNLFDHYFKISDYWLIVNNSGINLEFIAEGIRNNDLEIYNHLVWKEMQKNYELDKRREA